MVPKPVREAQGQHEYEHEHADATVGKHGPMDEWSVFLGISQSIFFTTVSPLSTAFGTTAVVSIGMDSAASVCPTPVATVLLILLSTMEYCIIA